MSIKSPFRAGIDALIHEGPLPRQRASPLLATRCYCDFSQGQSNQGPSQTQDSSTDDSRVGVDGDNATVVKDANTGDVTINTLAGDVATNALNVAEELGKAGGSTAVELARTAYDALEKLVESNEAITRNALNGAGDVAAGSLAAATAANSEASARAAEVAASQSKFLATQTGQDSLVKVIKYGAVAAGVMVLGGIAYAVTRGSKSA